MSTPRIYVACLSSYNAGELHGAWIDADQSAEEIHAEIAAVLAKSKHEPHEEFAIHDFECFGGIELSEYESIDRVAELAALLSDFPGEVVAAAMDRCGKDEDGDDLKEWIEENYEGTYRTIEDWAEQQIDDLGTLSDCPDFVKQYFDYAAYANDCECGGEIFTRNGGDGILVFRNR